MSARHMEVVVNGQTYVVEIGEPRGAQVSVRVNGQTYEVTVKSLVAAESVREPQPVVSAVKPVSPQSKAPASNANTIHAPMPGNIVAVEVKPGETVAVGQTLLTLEAMKMKNAIRSPRAGVVAAVTVAAGQAVAHGDVLVTFE